MLDRLGIARLILVLVAFVLPIDLSAQHRVDARNLHERIWAVVPVIGAGTAEDPKRPAYTPAPPRRGEAPVASPIIGYSAQFSEDGEFALVEFVARDRSAFREILADRRPGVRVFEKGKAQRAEVEAEFRKHKRDFDFDRFGVSLP
ncbi:MAG: hypothetical protein L0Z53_20040 [Acidobacteriales bacterium]|nr:hypothetical protein [Terriglobales bacterium]